MKLLFVFIFFVCSKEICASDPTASGDNRTELILRWQLGMLEALMDRQKVTSTGIKSLTTQEAANTETLSINMQSLFSTDIVMLKSNRSIKLSDLVSALFRLMQVNINNMCWWCLLDTQVEEWIHDT